MTVELVTPLLFSPGAFFRRKNLAWQLMSVYLIKQVVSVVILRNPIVRYLVCCPQSLPSSTT
jgi:hypothetical protein